MRSDQWENLYELSFRISRTQDEVLQFEDNGPTEPLHKVRDCHEIITHYIMLRTLLFPFYDIIYHSGRNMNTDSVLVKFYKSTYSENLKTMTSEIMQLFLSEI